MKTTKSIFAYLFLALTMSFTSGMLVSCSDDEIDPNGLGDYYVLAVAYDVNYVVKAVDEKVLRDLADLQIEYFDEAGVIRCDTITEAQWTKSQHIEVGSNKAIGLRARWIMRDREELEALLASELAKGSDSRTMYNLYIDISSPYERISADGTRVESVFSTFRSPNLSNREYSLEAILANMYDKSLTAEFYWYATRNSEDSDYYMTNKDKSFPKVEVAYDVEYIVKITDSKTIRDLADLEISFIDSEGNVQKRLLTEYQTFQSGEYRFMADAGFIGLQARWVFRDRDVLDALLAEELEKSESLRRRYSFDIDISSPCTKISRDGTSSEERLSVVKTEGIPSSQYTVERVVDELLDTDMKSMFGYKIVKQDNGLLLETIGDFPEE